MKTRVGYIVGSLLMLCSLAFVTAEDPPVDEQGFVSLFDGRTFEGWEGDRNVFQIQDEAIVGGSVTAPVARNEFLCTKKEFADFELRLKFKLLGAGANAGIQLRSRRIADHHEMIGYQADLGDGWWGCLYDESRRNKVLAGPPDDVRAKIVKPDQWNDYRIRCQGRRIELWINGQQTVDYTESDESLEQVGLIGLQIHGGPPSEAWYKEIRIKKL
ncbi:MAG: 3-keto-disaccharide hydrolase [Pirellulaceae bacterium]